MRILVFLIKIILILIVLGIGVIGFLAYDFYRFKQTPFVVESPIDFTISPGETALQIINSLKDNYIIQQDLYFKLLVKLDSNIVFKAGKYQLQGEYTPLSLIQLFHDGQVIQQKITIIEGWTFKQLRQALHQHPDIEQTLANATDNEIMQLIIGEEKVAEGLFFPSTYFFAEGTKDIVILEQAYKKMQVILEQAWQQRQADLPLNNPYEALILASIIEKETGKAKERKIIASVFTNRLYKNMKLQTDPTVIYGLGEKFNGNLTRKHLTTDTPYNTYTRYGLTPTPIALPGKEAIFAATNPEDTDYYYFVAKGQTGEHYFSKTYQEHQKAVRKYQLNK